LKIEYQHKITDFFKPICHDPVICNNVILQQKVNKDLIKNYLKI